MEEIFPAKNSEPQKKLECLKEIFAKSKSAAVAFSGGVDSAFLLKVASDVLGKKAVAINADSILVPSEEKNRAKNFCKEREIPFYKICFDPLAIKKIKRNQKDRCYFCKKEIFFRIQKKAKSLGIKNVFEGTNASDAQDFRPGIKALSELKIRSPLFECGFTKSEIRFFSKKMKIEFWSEPSSACLASRVFWGESLSEKKLFKIWQAENFLRQLGFLQCRVRLHKNLARIEIDPCDQEKFFPLKNEVNSKLKKIGFDFVALDLQGFRTGSMNEALK